jgi:hypothetical protein
MERVIFPKSLDIPRYVLPLELKIPFSIL